MNIFRKYKSLFLSLFLALGFSSLSQAQWSPYSPYSHEQIDRLNLTLPKATKAGSAPFILDHGYQTQHSALLIHGLTDSPYYMRSIAEVLYARGWNVVAILLRGHGTFPEDLAKARLVDWESNVRTGYEIARRLGKRVSMGGFSTGGALTIEAALSREFQLASILLFAPGVAFADPTAGLSCVLKGVKPWLDADLKEDNDYRYRKTSVSSVCELKKLMQKVSAVKNAGNIRVPVYMAITEADARVSVDKLVAFANGIRTPKMIVRYPKALGIEHAKLTRPETNPRFDNMKFTIEEFLSEEVEKNDR